MASPDFSQYIDLTIYDVDAFQAYTDAIAYARTAVPEFSPRAGTLEEAIMQAVSYNTALISSQINRLPDGLMEGILQLLGLSRNEATFATGTAQFTVYDDTGVTVPVSTVIAYETVSDDIVTSYAFETTADLVIPVGDTTGTVAIRSLTAGVHPALLTGQEMQLISPAPTVVAVELASSLSVGTNTETDAQFFNRGAQYLASLSSALTTKQQMANHIRAFYPNIGAFTVLDLTKSVDDGGTMEWAGVDDAGYVTILGTDINGDSLTPEDWAILYADISAKSVAGLTIGYKQPEEFDMTVDVEIVVANGYVAADVRTAVDTYLTNKLSVTGYDFSQTVIKNQLISEVAGIAGVAYVSSLVLTSGSPSELTDDGNGNLEFVHKYGVPNPIVEVTSV